LPRSLADWRWRSASPVFSYRKHTGLAADTTTHVLVCTYGNENWGFDDDLLLASRLATTSHSGSDRNVSLASLRSSFGTLFGALFVRPGHERKQINCDTRKNQQSSRTHGVAGVTRLISGHAVVLIMRCRQPSWIVNVQAAPVGLHNMAGEAECRLLGTLHVVVVTERPSEDWENEECENGESCRHA
jgi:hypothetical protein